jgi:hypothetical protein
MQLSVYLRAASVNDTDGRWVTISGVHVFISEDGTILKGPKSFIGKKPDDIGHMIRVNKAKSSAVRTGYKEQLIADRSEAVLSRAIGIPRTRDNSAFDLRNDDTGVEVKTLVNGTHGSQAKITMSKAALGRKLAEQRAAGLKGYTVVCDRRAGGLTGAARYYYKEGFGSFRLHSMTPATLSELKEIVRG